MSPVKRRRYNNSYVLLTISAYRVGADVYGRTGAVRCSAVDGLCTPARHVRNVHKPKTAKRYNKLALISWCDTLSSGSRVWISVHASASLECLVFLFLFLFFFEASDHRGSLGTPSNFSYNTLVHTSTMLCLGPNLVAFFTKQTPPSREQRDARYLFAVTSTGAGGLCSV